ncbi:MAG: sugar kinase [Candidatus Omnitrophica bacterium]|nr:sugar kinase [Candidatus Omnitrophota bacterium]
MDKISKGVLCAGIAVADVVVKPVTGLPEEGKLQLVDEIELHCGGCAVNTAIGLARFGINSGLSGRVGQDGFGSFLKENLAREGVSTSGLKMVAGERTSATAVMVSPTGERSFLHFLGANRNYSAADFDLQLFADYRILHLAGILLTPSFDGEPAASVMRQAKEAGLVTSLDTAWDATGRWLKAVDPILPYTDLFLPSIEEARMLSGLKNPEEIADFFLKKGVKVVALKMGSEGSYFKSALGEDGFVPIYPVEVKDTTGAGDAFVAGFLAGYLQDWPLPRVARLANAVGALAASKVGATAGIRSWAETLRFADKGFEE